MSKSALGKIAKSVLEEILTKNIARGPLVGQDGQILAVSVSRFKEAIKDIWQDDISDDELNKVWKLWSAYLKTQIRSIGRGLNRTQKKRRLEELGAAARSNPPIGDERYFFIAKYETIKKEKSGNRTLGKIIQKVLGPRATGDKLKRIGGKDYGDDGGLAGVQLGHEEGGRGYAASSVKAAFAKQKLSKSKAQGVEKLQKFIADYENQLSITLDHTQIVDNKGNLRKDYVPILTWQKAVDNQTFKDAEEAAINELQNQFKDFVDLEGSPSLKQAVEQTLLYNLAGKPFKGKTVTGVKKKKVTSTGKGTAKKKYKQKSKETVIRGNEIGKVGSLKSKSRGSTDLFSIANLINTKLPQTIRKNMGAPALENRSGRFAGSAKITDVMPTKRGFPSFGYVYEEYPYRIFEVGSGRTPWANRDRDPRNLIDKSIREIAANLAIGRFYTRRN